MHFKTYLGKTTDPLLSAPLECITGDPTLPGSHTNGRILDELTLLQLTQLAAATAAMEGVLTSLYLLN